ncbi:ribosomal lysine N-methyltransferase 3 [Rosa rugosa]|uniref:ribosomal lysine N-methyltransferase 3 n=1 Tax=Rosa rugosa TaxID=74645 RepID=UPI002B416D98|nr:ribosomal lysine N-methyltransferase 3 [Rosa rugosa]
MEMAARRVRAFKRWMKREGIQCSDALDLTVSATQGLSVTALADLHVGDAVARIPKATCLTVITTAARDMIDAAGLDGSLGLAVAIMHERSLGEQSHWAPYLAVLPEQEPIPLVWTAEELLRGTELHDTVKEDRGVMLEDWKESIEPLQDQIGSTQFESFFGFEEYLAARTLVASRSFQIDDHYHGVGMVPLADIFNHKTAAEDVHLNTSASTENSESDTTENSGSEEGNESANESTTSTTSSVGASTNDDVASSATDDDGDDDDLEMVMVKDVKVGAEVFNTYGLLGNAALLHRYGFTEPDNPFDIVNIDLELVLQWSASLFSGQHRRARLSLWRRLGYSGCASHNSEYFEISFNGEPPNELLLLLYIMLLQQDAYDKIDLALATTGNSNGHMDGILSDKTEKLSDITAEFSEAVLLTNTICNALLSLADMRESLYGKNSIQDDIEALKRCCSIKEKKLYHSLMLRISERRIIQKFRTFATSGSQVTTGEQASPRKKLKRK